MPFKPFPAGNDVVQKTQRWNQDQIDQVEKAKEEQRRREQEANQQRNADSRNGQR
jgi:hypothetical protein